MYLVSVCMATSFCDTHGNHIHTPISYKEENKRMLDLRFEFEFKLLQGDEKTKAELKDEIKKISKATKTLPNLESRVAACEAKEEELEKHVVAHEGKIASLEGKVKSLSDGLQAEVGSLCLCVCARLCPGVRACMCVCEREQDGASKYRRRMPPVRMIGGIKGTDSRLCVCVCVCVCVHR